MMGTQTIVDDCEVLKHSIAVSDVDDESHSDPGNLWLNSEDIKKEQKFYLKLAHLSPELLEKFNLTCINEEDGNEQASDGKALH